MAKYEIKDGVGIIPEGTTVVEAKAFADCEELKNVVIPDSVTRIGYAAFAYCGGLTNIIIPDSVTEIGQEAFADCHKLTIHAPAGSYAEQYAKENNIPFVAE